MKYLSIDQIKLHEQVKLYSAGGLVRLSLILALVCGIASASFAETINVPPHDLSVFPKNLARNHIGAGIEIYGNSTTGNNVVLSQGLKDKNDSPISQLADDPTIGYPFAKGQTVAVVTLPGIQALRYLSFLTAEGLSADMKIFTSAEKIEHDSDKWIPVRAIQIRPSEFQYAVDLSGIEARYLKLEVATTQTGRIAGFGVYGAETILDFIEQDSELFRNRSKDQKTPVDFDFGALYAGSAVRYVSSARDASHAGRMIDDDPLTGFAFSPDDENPLMIIDLGSPRLLSRASFVTSGMAGTIEISLRASTALKEQETPVEERGESAPAPGTLPDSGNFAKKGEIVLPQQLAAKKSVFTQVANSGAAPASSLQGRQSDDPQRFEEDNGYFTVAKLEDKDGSIRKSVDFEPQIARFVLVRFTPARRVSLSGSNFFISDVSVFGDIVSGTPEGDSMTIEPTDTTSPTFGGGTGGAINPQPALFIPAEDPNPGSN